jgi:hypothetical protein
MVERVYRSFWLGCCVLGVASPVYAAELHWDAPEGCPDLHALERETEQVLGEPLANYPLQVAASVTQNAAQLSLSLRITLPANAETRERELQAASCQELLEAAAVAIALAAAESGEQPDLVPQNTEPAEPPPRAAAVAAEAPVASSVEISAAATSAWGPLPQLGLGGELQLAWVRSWLRVGVAGTWFPVRSMQVSDDMRASFGLYFAQLLACGHYSLVRAHLFGCATGTLGRMGAHLDGPAQARTQTTAWRALGLRLGVSYPILPPLELTASLAVMAPMTRPRFYTQPSASEVLHQPAALSAQLLLGVLFSL